MKCLRSEGLGCFAISDRVNCLSSKDGSTRVANGGLKVQGEPCVWCGDGACTSESEAKCAPYDWFVRGEGVAYATNHAYNKFDVAKCKDDADAQFADEAVACLADAKTGCNSLQDEQSCLSSRDGRPYEYVAGFKARGQPCVWCGGLQCTSGNDNKCEPYDYAVNGEGHAFNSFHASAAWKMAACEAGQVVSSSLSSAYTHGTTLQVQCGYGPLAMWTHTSRACGECQVNVPQIKDNFKTCGHYCARQPGMPTCLGAAIAHHASSCDVHEASSCDYEFKQDEDGICKCSVVKPLHEQIQMLYAQCGGKDWKGFKSCQAGAVCNVVNEWYSQCQPALGGTPGAKMNPPPEDVALGVNEDEVANSMAAGAGAAIAGAAAVGGAAGAAAGAHHTTVVVAPAPKPVIAPVIAPVVSIPAVHAAPAAKLVTPEPIKLAAPPATEAPAVATLAPAAVTEAPVVATAAPLATVAPAAVTEAPATMAPLVVTTPEAPAIKPVEFTTPEMPKAAVELTTPAMPKPAAVTTLAPLEPASVTMPTVAPIVTATLPPLVKSKEESNDETSVISSAEATPVPLSNSMQAGLNAAVLKREDGGDVHEQAVVAAGTSGSYEVGTNYASQQTAKKVAAQAATKIYADAGGVAQDEATAKGEEAMEEALAKVGGKFAGPDLLQRHGFSDCWEPCGSKPGYCENFCGRGNACCRKSGDDFVPPECSGVYNFYTPHYECIRPAVIYNPFAKSKDEANQTVMVVADEEVEGEAAAVPDDSFSTGQWVLIGATIVLFLCAAVVCWTLSEGNKRSLALKTTRAVEVAAPTPTGADLELQAPLQAAAVAPPVMQQYRYLPVTSQGYQAPMYEVQAAPAYEVYTTSSVAMPTPMPVAGGAYAPVMSTPVPMAVPMEPMMGGGGSAALQGPGFVPRP